MVEIVQAQRVLEEWDPEAGLGEAPGETGYVSYVLRYYSRSLQMIILVI